MVNNDLVDRVSKMACLDDKLDRIGKEAKSSGNEKLICTDCGEFYPAVVEQVTGNNCPGCYQEKEFGILPGSPECFDNSLPDQFPSDPDYFPTDHPLF